MIDCPTTHHTGCACHEARRDAEVADLRAQLAAAHAELHAVLRATGDDLLVEPGDLLRASGSVALTVEALMQARAQLAAALAVIERVREACAVEAIASTWSGYDLAHGGNLARAAIAALLPPKGEP